MTDRIDFEAAFGPLGRLVQTLVLAGCMKRLIEQRNEFLVRGAWEKLPNGYSSQWHCAGCSV